MTIEYSEVYIGDCTYSDCTRPATVRAHKEFVVCTLHHALYEASEVVNDADLAEDLIKVWRSQAELHGLDALMGDLDGLTERHKERSAEAAALVDALRRVDEEGDGAELRAEMGKRLREGAPQ
jgi:hypothetical protein